MIRFLTAFALAVPTLATAKEPLLNIPLDCRLGANCYINDLPDRDPTMGVLDYACGSVTRDGHNGTDFALFTAQVMREGVDVIAAAPGKVIAVRNGEADISTTDPNVPDIAGKECGNGVVLSHGGGWTTQYCHLKKDSLRVQRGDRMRLGSILGQVGMSGLTNYPHVHFTVAKDGEMVDPFHPHSTEGCIKSTTDTGMWQQELPYVAGGFIRAGFAEQPPKFSGIRDGQPHQTTLAPGAPTLVAWVHGFSVQQGDVLTSVILDPDGNVFAEDSQTQPKNQKFRFWYLGKRRRDAPWPPGEYTAQFTLSRGGTVASDITVKTLVISP